MTKILSGYIKNSLECHLQSTKQKKENEFVKYQR